MEFGVANGERNKEEKQEESLISTSSTQQDQEEVSTDEYFDSLPPGYKFCPSDYELVIHYLMRKIMNMKLPLNKIKDVNIYLHNPEHLAANYQRVGEKEWYFFTPRNRKYRNGNRPNRAAGDGYWKATGADKQIKFEGHIIGLRKALVFYLGRPPNGKKTNWIMHEFKEPSGPGPRTRTLNNMRLDDWVLCKIYKKVDRSNRVKKSKSALSENSSPLNNDNTAENDLAQMSCDNNVGYLNDTNGGVVQPSFHNLILWNDTTGGGRLQPSFYNEIPDQIQQQFSDGNCLPKYDQPLPGVDLGTRPIGFNTSSQSFDGVSSPSYVRKFQEDIWGFTNSNVTSQIDFSSPSYMDPFPDNIDPTNLSNN